MLTANDIRKKFLDFFAAKGHTIVASDSLVPKDDPTVLFTTAGMQQFKRQFLGNIDEYTRAASSQKCLRTDDLDQVGQTAFHHTFFEMLGNFSFGDYFKQEAITWGWEFLTKDLQIPAEKLWASIYQDDTEAEEIWLNDIKISSKKLVRLGDKSNFWPSEAKAKGPNGPCGPCSEIFYDYGVNPKCKNKNCNPDCDCGRFSEVWNLVFTQFNRKDGGQLEGLPGKNIDTGMGLERLTAVIQGKKNNFETDLFAPIVTTIADVIEQDSIKIEKREKFIIADHIRAIVFAINDGVIPSNKERGSVVKRLINDSTNIVLSQGGTKPSIYKLVDTVVEVMQEPYPALKKKAKDIAALIKKAEEACITVLKQRTPEFIKELKKLDTKNPAEWVHTVGGLFFTYRDTYGLPVKTMKDLVHKNLPNLKEKHLELAVSIFNDKMLEQQERSRSASKICGDVFTHADLDLNVPKTEFLGYSEFSSKGKIVRIFKGNDAVDSASAGEDVKIVLDQTPFYPESGGQIGDTGILKGKKNQVRIIDTQKVADIYLHYAEILEGVVNVGDTLEVIIDVDRRLAIMRNHTATHLLQAALREVLGSHVQQQGSLVAEDRLRFDFTHPEGIKSEQIARIENYVNKRILNCDSVKKEIMSIDQARQSGALAFFAEKYGETVRVVSIAGYSKEFCGGTHLDSTGQIGLFKISQECAIAQGIRRIEAKTGTGALDLVNQQSQTLAKIAKVTKASSEDVAQRVERQTKRIKALEKELAKFQFEAIKNQLDSILEKAQTINDIKVITHNFKDVEMDVLRKITDLLKQKSKSSVIILGGHSAGNAYIISAVTDDLIKKGLKANEIIEQLAPVINGSGGGRPQLAQAGSKETKKIDQALTEAVNILTKTINLN